MKNNPERLGGWFVFALTATLALWASYPSVFVTGGTLLVFGAMSWREDSRSILPKVLGSGAVLAASFAAMYVLIGKAQAEAAPWLVTLPTWSCTFALFCCCCSARCR